MVPKKKNSIRKVNLSYFHFDEIKKSENMKGKSSVAQIRKSCMNPIKFSTL